RGSTGSSLRRTGMRLRRAAARSRVVARRHLCAFLHQRYRPALDTRTPRDRRRPTAHGHRQGAQGRTPKTPAPLSGPVGRPSCQLSAPPALTPAGSTPGNRFELGELLDSVVAPFPADAALLESAEDTGDAAATESVNRIVGDANRFVLGLVSDHGEDRTEDFLLSNPHVVARVDEQ